jgi:hypothetical protein
MVKHQDRDHGNMVYRTLRDQGTGMSRFGTLFRGSHLPQLKGLVVKAVDEPASSSLSVVLAPVVPDVDPVTAGQADAGVLGNEHATWYISLRALQGHG